MNAAPKIYPNPWILGTRTAPEWARMWSGHSGSPPKEENWGDYANFVNVMITALDPWGVELFNEPDVESGKAVEDYYGAWVAEDGSFYEAGAYYGQVTAFVYPLIKAQHPDVKIIVGALQAVNMEFLRGAVDGGLTGDMLSVHKYIKTREEFGLVFDHG